jgi:post-segregation antitoxin (ccd killing protein)
MGDTRWGRTILRRRAPGERKARDVAAHEVDRASAPSERTYSRRMPRMQVYLPEELYKVVKEQHLPASELLQDAVRAELHRQELLAETDRYVEELLDEVGEPSPRVAARAERLAAEIGGRSRRRKAV